MHDHTTLPSKAVLAKHYSDWSGFVMVELSRFMCYAQSWAEWILGNDMHNR